MCRAAGARVLRGPAEVLVALSAVRKEDQAQVKGIRWMPWHREAMKDVALCDKLRGGESSL